MLRSFDFDDTLLSFTLGPNETMVQKLRDAYDEGDEIIIVTARTDGVKSRLEIESFLAGVGVHSMITKVCFTAGGGKGEVILDEALTLGHREVVHYDDDEDNLQEIRSWIPFAASKGVKIEVVHVDAGR